MQLFANGCSGTLVDSIDTLDISLELVLFQAVHFPLPANGDYIMLTLQDEKQNIEVVRCEQRDLGVFTIMRGYDGTKIQAFPAGSRVELREAAGAFTNLLQREGDVVNGGTFGEE